jgi:type II secretory pathway component PulJ
MTLRALRTGQRPRRAFSVLELLIATTIAMVILLVVTKWFSDLSTQTARSRALVELSSQMRAVIAQLESDMRGATFPRGAMPGSNDKFGYIQYVEGMATDASPAWSFLANSRPGPVTVANSMYMSGSNVGTRVVQPSPNLQYYFGNLGVDAPLATEPNSRFGDMDDVLCLTTRQTDTPFRGSMLFVVPVAPTPDDPLLGTSEIESPIAEVIWWVEGNDENGDGYFTDAERLIRRRAFLIRPDLASALRQTYLSLKSIGLNDSQATQVLLEQCDISFHLEFDTSINGVVPVANSLGDLATQRYTDNDALPAFPTVMYPVPKCKRITLGLPNHGNLSSERNLTAFRFEPVSWYATYLSPFFPNMTISKERYGNEVVLSSVAAFDIRVFDPAAPLWMHTHPTTTIQTPVNPGDPAYLTAAGQGVQIGVGAFVDLNYAATRNPAVMGTGASWFSGPPSEYSGFFRTTGNGAEYTHLLATFDTWAPLQNVQIDGIDTNGDFIADETDELLQELPGNNPVAADAKYIAPPYPYQLRALQVTLRAYDPDSKQIRQMKASASYTND